MARAVERRCLDRGRPSDHVECHREPCLEGAACRRRRVIPDRLGRPRHRHLAGGSDAHGARLASAARARRPVARRARVADWCTGSAGIKIRTERRSDRRAGRAPDATTSLVVEAFARRDGRRLWELQPRRHRSLPGAARETQPRDADAGYRRRAHVTPGSAMDRSSRSTWTAALVWTRHLGVEYSPFETRWGHGSSPALYGDLLILLCDHVPKRICWRSTRAPARSDGRSIAARTRVAQHAAGCSRTPR